MPPIRHASQADLAALLALYQHLNQGEPPPAPDRAAPALAAIIASPLTTIFIAERAGEVASSCTLAIIPNLTRNARPYALIENVVTAAHHQKHGLGQAVLHAALDAAWAADCYKVMLATGSKNPATLRFYETAGFSSQGKTFFQIRRA